MDESETKHNNQPVFTRQMLEKTRTQTVRFIEDSDGLLGMNDCIFVITSLVSIWFLLIQSIADMFKGGNEFAEFTETHLNIGTGIRT